MNDSYYGAPNDYRGYYLAHHGILGQKWGVRRFQNADGSYTAAGRDRYGIKSNNKNDTKATNSIVVMDPGLATIMSIINGGKIIGEAVAETVREKKAEKNLLNKLPNDITVEDLKAVNSKRSSAKGAERRGYYTNCPKCTTAMELRKRGIDAVANKGSGFNDDEISKLFKQAPYYTRQYVDNVKNALTKMPSGASGCIAGNYAFGGGHILNWTKVNDDIRIEDGQSAKVYSWDQFVKHYNFDTDSYCYSRWDNTEPNWNIIKKRGVLAKGGK